MIDYIDLMVVVINRFLSCLIINIEKFKFTEDNKHNMFYIHNIFVPTEKERLPLDTEPYGIAAGYNAV